MSEQQRPPAQEAHERRSLSPMNPFNRIDTIMKGYSFWDTVSKFRYADSIREVIDIWKDDFSARAIDRLSHVQQVNYYRSLDKDYQLDTIDSRPIAERYSTVRNSLRKLYTEPQIKHLTLLAFKVFPPDERIAFIKSIMDLHGSEYLANYDDKRINYLLSIDQNDAYQLFEEMYARTSDKRLFISPFNTGALKDMFPSNDRSSEILEDILKALPGSFEHIRDNIFSITLFMNAEEVKQHELYEPKRQEVMQILRDTLIPTTDFFQLVNTRIQAELKSKLNNLSLNELYYFYHFITSNESVKYSTILNSPEDAGVFNTTLETIFDDETLCALAENEEAFRFHLGFLLSKRPRDSLSNKLTELLEIQIIDDNLVVHPSYENWVLCDRAEGLTREALKKNSFIVLNDRLAIKYEGRRAGLLTQSFSTPFGTAIRGNFYAAMGRLSNEIKMAIEDNKGKINSEGDLVLIRAFRPENSNDIELLENIAVAVENQDEQLPEYIGRWRFRPMRRNLYAKRRHELLGSNDPE